MGALSRRGVIARLGVLAGAGVLLSPAAAAEAAVTGTRRDDSSDDRLTCLAAVGLRYVGSGARKAGESTALRAVLTDQHGKKQLGSLVVTATRLEGQYGATEDVAWLQTQLFTLAKGTVSATGTVTHGGCGTFVINGGTGAYSGLRGSYVTQQTADASGGGTATFTFTTHS